MSSSLRGTGLLPTPDATHGRKTTRTSSLLPGVAESLLPTPAAGNFNDGEDPASWEERRQRNLAKGYNGNGQGTPLGMAVRMLPTPAASDVKGLNPAEHRRDGEIRPECDDDLPTRISRLLPTPTGQNSHGNATRSDGRPLLPGVAESLLPTPRVSGGSDIMKPCPSSNTGKHGLDLGPAVGALLPSPRASDGEKGGPNQHGSSGDLMLTSAVHHLLRTPTAQLAVNGGSQHPDKRRAGGHQPTLADEVEHLLLPTPNATDAGGARPVPGQRTHDGPDHGPRLQDVAVNQLLPAPQVADVTGGHKSRSGDRRDEPLLPGVVEQLEDHGGEIDWGPYAYAIYRWAEVIGRMPPSPVEPGKNGKPRLSPRFVEWMQGLPEGWVTGVPKLSRNAQLKGLGNGVVPRQAFLAEIVLVRRAPGWVRARVSRVWQTR